MSFRSIVICVALAALSCGAANAQAPVSAEPARTGTALTQADAKAWLDGLMPTALRLARVPGAVVVIVKDGAPLIEAGYGVADWNRQTPVDPRTTLFRPGSISKVFTWTAVMQLVEQGKLDLDTDVNRYLDFTIPVRNGKPITLRHIMTHTTGFEETLRDLLTYDGPTPDIGAWVKKHLPPQQFDAGTTPSYSNYATTLAGYIVQRASGQTFDDYVDAHIFGPLGMRHSTLRQPLPPEWRHDMATGYLSSDEKGRGFETVNVAPAGALATTGDDMSRFMLAWLQGGRAGDAQILQPRTVEAMFTAAPRALPDLAGMALGFFRRDVNGHRVAAHAGDTLYFHSYLALFIDDHIGIFMSVNGLGRNDQGEHLRDSVFQEFADRYLPGPHAQPASSPPAFARDHARLIAGAYLPTRGGESNFLSLVAALAPQTIVANDDATIRLDLDGERHVYAETARPFLWKEVGGADLLQAIVKDGKVVRWSLDATAAALVWEPLPGLAGTPLMLPLLLGALGVVLLTALQWPCAALARRYHRIADKRAKDDVRSLCGVRVVCVVTLLALGMWTAVLVRLGDDHLDIPAAVFLAEALTLLALVGGIAASLWRLRVAARPGHGVASRLVGLAWAAAFGMLAATAVAYHWIGFNPNY